MIDQLMVGPKRITEIDEIFLQRFDYAAAVDGFM